jgi:hypothetical protein
LHRKKRLLAALLIGLLLFMMTVCFCKGGDMVDRRSHDFIDASLTIYSATM